MEFRCYSQLVKDAYYTWGIPVALWVRKHPNGKLARLLKSLMVARCQKKFIGVAPVAVVTFLAGCYMLARRFLSGNFYRSLYRTSSPLETGEQE